VTKLGSDEDQLSTLADKVNAAIYKVQIALHGMGLGVKASVTLNPHSERRLTFKKHDRAWVLTVDDLVSTTELVHTSLETRIEAVKRLPELYQALLDARKVMLVELHDAAASAEAFAKELGGNQ
jgi:hypothetical protein